MQTELAMDIFEHVFGPQPRSRYVLVAHVDWSQNHAATAPDALDAEKMLVGSGGKSAKHIRDTWWADPRPNPPKRAILCTPGCSICLHKLNEARILNDPHHQTIGVKGLKLTLAERGMQASGQAAMVAKLQECDDFSPKKVRRFCFSVLTLTLNLIEGTREGLRN